MSTSRPSPALVEHHPEHHRFEYADAGHLAMLEYRLTPGRIVFTHTGVPAELEGLGVASALAQAGLEHARREGLEVLPLCPFVKAYIGRHPEYAPLVGGKLDSEA